MDEFFTRGWVKFAAEPRLSRWAAHADQAAMKAEADEAHADWHRCGGTWFAGVNVLPNDADGQLPGGPELAGKAVEAARALIGKPFAFDRAQASVCYPGYPQPGPEEEGAPFRFRRDRGAAHLDGLHRIMPGRRRVMQEFHGFLLGIGLSEVPEGAAPFTIWNGSHEILRAGLREAFKDVPSSEWTGTDITEAYQAMRRRCFEDCERVDVPLRPGEAILAHRLALHGTSTWTAGPEGRRAIAWFRPEPFPGADPCWWLEGR